MLCDLIAQVMGIQEYDSMQFILILQDIRILQMVIRHFGKIQLAEIIQLWVIVLDHLLLQVQTI